MKGLTFFFCLGYITPSWTLAGLYLSRLPPLRPVLGTRNYILNSWQPSLLAIVKLTVFIILRGKNYSSFGWIVTRVVYDTVEFRGVSRRNDVLQVRFWVLCDSMVKQGISPEEWVYGKRLETPSKLLKRSRYQI